MSQNQMPPNPGQGQMPPHTGPRPMNQGPGQPHPMNPNQMPPQPGQYPPPPYPQPPFRQPADMAQMERGVFSILKTFGLYGLYLINLLCVLWCLFLYLFTSIPDAQDLVGMARNPAAAMSMLDNFRNIFIRIPFLACFTIWLDVIVALLVYITKQRKK